MKQNTYLGLGANTVCAINPDVLGHARALLVEIHVLHELEFQVSNGLKVESWESFELTFSVLEMVVDSA